MTDRRSGQDRRSIQDRRTGRTSIYRGKENRNLKRMRNKDDRRKKSDKTFLKMSVSLENEGRRSGLDQRHFKYAGIIPERRSGKDRRRLDEP